MKPESLHADPAGDTPCAVARRPQAVQQEGLTSDWTALHRGAGNQAIQRMLAAAVAQSACDCGTCEKCQAKHEHGHGPGEETLSSGFLSGKGSGQPLGDSVRGFMEERFGQDFGGVRVHTDGHAARSAREISAVAYTAGSDIFFAPGQYRPDSQEGRHLLAHELTHVIQQGGSPVSAQAQLTVGAADDSFEREADRVADAVMGGTPGSTTITPLCRASLQRKRCVTGAFTGAGAAFRTAEQKGEEEPPAVRAVWNGARGLLESPFTIEAEFKAAGGKQVPCGEGRVRLTAQGSATRTAPKSATKKSALIQVHTGPNEETFEDAKNLSMFYVPQTRDCKLWAEIAPSIRAEQAGEQLDGYLYLSATLYDRCDPEEQEEPQDRIDWIVKFDQIVPADFKPQLPAVREVKAAGSQTKDVPQKTQGSETKDVPQKEGVGNKSVEAKEGSARKDCVTGRFTNIPSGSLKFIWNPASGQLEREFQMAARFEPVAGETDCTQGEYRQFVHAQVERDGKLMTEAKEGVREGLFTREVEDRHGRQVYGHRGTNFNKGYGADGKSCLFHNRDAPTMQLANSGRIETRSWFIGQLIDLCRVDRPDQDSPYTEGVLAQSAWTLEGEHAQAPANCSFGSCWPSSKAAGERKDEP